MSYRYVAHFKDKYFRKGAKKAWMTTAELFVSKHKSPKTRYGSLAIRSFIQQNGCILTHYRVGITWVVFGPAKSASFEICTIWLHCLSADHSCGIGVFGSISHVISRLVYSRGRNITEQRNQEKWRNRFILKVGFNCDHNRLVGQICREV